MKFWDWTFWRIGKQYNYNPLWKSEEVKTNKGRWKRFFRGYFFLVDSKDICQ